MGLNRGGELIDRVENLRRSLGRVGNNSGQKREANESGKDHCGGG